MLQLKPHCINLVGTMPFLHQTICSDQGHREWSQGNGRPRDRTASLVHSVDELKYSDEELSKKEKPESVKFWGLSRWCGLSTFRKSYSIGPVTRLKLSMGPIRGPYSLYPRHVRTSMLPKKDLSIHTMHFKWHHRNMSKNNNHKLLY